MELSQYENLKNTHQQHSSDNVKACFELLLQLVWLSLGFYLSSLTTVWWVLGQVIIGTGFWRSFAIMHAAGHGGFFTSKKLNDATGLLMSLTCHIPYYPWKFVHHEHHRWTGWIDLDPTMMDIASNDLPELHKKIVNFAWKWWIPLLTLVFIAKNFFTFRHQVTQGQRKLMCLSSIFLLVAFHLGLIIWLGSNYLKLFGLSTFIYFTMGDLSLLAQHVGLPMEKANGETVKPKPLHQHAIYSRTMILPEWFDRLIALGFNQHALHHLFPKRPYYLKNENVVEIGHTNDWKDWIRKAKSLKATELIYPEV